MNVKFYAFFALVVISFSARAESGYVGQFKNNYFLGCSREMSSGVDAVPLDLAMSICSCAALSVIRTYDIEQLKLIDRDIASNYKLLLPHTERCTNIEMPKYIERHPEFLQQYIQQHPELFQ